MNYQQHRTQLLPMTTPEKPNTPTVTTSKTTVPNESPEIRKNRNFLCYVKDTVATTSYKAGISTEKAWVAVAVTNHIDMLFQINEL